MTAQSREPATAAERLLGELSESPLPGARYARDVVERRLPAVISEAVALSDSEREWSAADHRADAVKVQAAMQRLAEARTKGVIFVPIEDASNLLMALHRDGIYRPEAAALADSERDYAAWVEATAAALHEDCRLEWQAIHVVDPGRAITMHGEDAHWGKAHDLVRRLHLADSEQVRAPGDINAAWQALTDDLHAEFDQGHMKVWVIIDRHRSPIERQAAALDVERLARAMDNSPGIVTSGWGYTPEEHLAECRELAPAIAAEYQRLAEPSR